MKSTQSNRPNDKSVKMPSTRKTNQQPATSTEARSHISSMSSCRRFDKLDIYLLLFFSCWLGVYIHGQCDIRVHGLRSLDHWLWFHPPIVSLRVSQSPWSSLMVLLTSTENKCFQKMNSQSPWSANAYREVHIWLVHQVSQAGGNYLRRYTTHIQGCEPCNNAGEQLCQMTVELCFSSKLSAFARGNDIMSWWSPPDHIFYPRYK